MTSSNPWAGLPAGTISVFHAFPPEIAGTQAELHVSVPTDAEPNAICVPVVLRYEDGRPLVVIYGHGGDEIWKLDLAQFQAALTKGAALIEQ